jgi:hypothetical protein
VFGFRQVSLEILHSEKGWAAIVLTSHGRGLWQQMFGCVCVCMFVFTLGLISIPVFFKHKITISSIDIYFSNNMVMALLKGTR